MNRMHKIIELDVMRTVSWICVISSFICNYHIGACKKDTESLFILQKRKGGCIAYIKQTPVETVLWV